MLGGKLRISRQLSEIYQVIFLSGFKFFVGKKVSNEREQLFPASYEFFPVYLRQDSRKLRRDESKWSLTTSQDDFFNESWQERKIKGISSRKTMEFLIFSNKQLFVLQFRGKSRNPSIKSSSKSLIEHSTRASTQP